MKIKDIKIIRQGNEFFAEVSGVLPNPAYEIVDIQRSYNKYCIDLVFTAENQNPNGMTAMVISGFRKTVNLGPLVPGKYCVRVNHNNDWVEWFTY